MSDSPESPARGALLLERALVSGRIHSAYLITGPPERGRAAAERFAVGLVCRETQERPCGACSDCRRARREGEPIELDGAGKRGPLYRHVGDHPDLLWVERGASDTRVRIGQIRGVQNALRLAAHEGGWRAAVIADAEWLNLEAQNALLRLLEEPPPQTCLLLVCPHASALIATIRSRCQRVAFPMPHAPRHRSPELAEEERALVARLDELRAAGLPELLDWAEEYRGERAAAASRVQSLLALGSDWLRERTAQRARSGERRLEPEIRAFGTLCACRRDLDRRNANPQMVAERALLALREAVAA